MTKPFRGESIRSPMTRIICQSVACSKLEMKYKQAYFRSVRVQLSAIFIGFLLLVAASVFATFWAIQTQAADATVINLAGRKRMLSQRLL